LLILKIVLKAASHSGFPSHIMAGFRKSFRITGAAFRTPLESSQALSESQNKLTEEGAGSICHNLYMISEKQAETSVLDFSNKAAKNCEKQQCPAHSKTLF
jgi:hypothetical protein